MLVLQVREGESLYLTDSAGVPIRLTVFSKGRAKIGVDAPKSVQVVRSTLLEKDGDICEVEAVQK